MERAHFLHCNRGNAVDEAAERLCVGVSRIADMGHQTFVSRCFDKPRNLPVWSHGITSAAYFAKGKTWRDRLPRPPRSEPAISYVPASHRRPARFADLLFPPVCRACPAAIITGMGISFFTLVRR